MKSADVVIERREGVTIYGKVIDKMGRLGQFEVHSDKLGNNGTVYAFYKEAENRMAALIGVQNDTGKPEDNGQQKGNQRNGRGYKGR